MAKSKKKRRPAKREKGYPPLSKTDKFLYTALEVLGAVFLITSISAYEPIAGFFIFNNAKVLAFQERWTILLLFPFIFVYLIFIGDSFYNKRPIFGNKKVDYYNTTNHKFILPLFDKRYKIIERYKDNRKKLLRKISLWSCALIILLTFAILGCIGRHEFSREGITIYSIFNNVIKEYSYVEVESYKVEAYYHSSYRARGLSYTDSDINLTVYFKNGDNCTASYNTAQDVFALEEIDKMLKGKNKTVDSHLLQDFIRRHDLSEDELKVIYRLFKT